MEAKLARNEFSSPVVGHSALRVCFVVCASRRWRVNLADIKTAFLNSDERDPDAEPTYLEPPSEGLPGVPAGALLLVLKDFYEFNDAPEKWRKRLDREQDKVIIGTPSLCFATAFAVPHDIRREQWSLPRL